MDLGPINLLQHNEMNSKLDTANLIVEKTGVDEDQNSVRLLVQEEGRAARNLIAFSVPCDMGQVDTSKVSRKPPSSPRGVMAVQEGKKEDDAPRNTKRTSDTSTPGSRVRSASTGRDKKSELQARYWAFLFGNLQRAVDEIYQTCETDESVSECKEVILVLENFTRDFHSLIEWFRLKWEYEKTPPPQRPTSLAWEIRKSSPGKIHHHGAPPLRSSVKRNLNFSEFLEKEKTKPAVEKALEGIKNGKCSPVIPTLTEDQEFSSAVAKPEEICTPHDETVGEESCCKQAIVLESGCIASNELPEIPKDQPSNESSAQSVMAPSNTESDAANSVPMMDQASQTDPELDETPVEPLMVDKGVGTAKTTIGSACRPPLSAAPAPVPVAVPALVPAGARAAPTVGAAKSVVSATRSCNGPGPGPGPPVRPSTSVPSTAARGPAPSSSGTASGTTTKPSTASIVKRGAPSPRQAASVCPAPSRTSGPAPGPAPVTARGPPPRPPPAPKLVRSRTVAEVSRPTRPQPNRPHRPMESGPRQHGIGSAGGQTGQLAQTRAARSFESGMDPRRAANRTKDTVNTHTALDGPKKIEPSDDGWETVKNRSRRFSYNPKSRFNQPTCAVSLPALIIVDNNDNIPSKQEELPKPTQSLKPNEERESTKISQNSKVKEISSKPSKSAIDKLTHSTSKSTVVKKMGKDVKEENNKMILKKKTQNLDCKTSKPVNGLGKAKNCGTLVSVTDQEKVRSKLKVEEEIRNKENNINVEEKKIEKEHRNIDVQTKEEMTSILKSLYSCTNKPADLDLDSQLSGDESSVGPRTSSTTTPMTMTPTTTPATPTTPTNFVSDTLEFLRDTDCSIDRLISDDEELLAERTLLKEEERKSQQLYEEEAKLQQQIHDLQAGNLEVEVETDGETQVGTEDDEEEEEELLDGDDPRDIEVDTMSLEDRYENMLEGLSWAERMDTLERLEALVARHPGRALQLHQKLSSPSRCRAITLPETLRRFQARQEKAQQKRERLLQLKSQRLRELLNKVGEVKAAQAQLTEDRRVRLENKLKRAEENRNLHLRSIKRKAHDEEEKLKEIAFINELEAQNKRHDFLALRQEQEERLQGIAEERQRKQEEKAAKEAAAEERRRALEAERLHKLEEMQARRKRRVERIHREQLEKEKERLEAAREKARDREERLSALHAAQLATQEELQKKIQQKQEDSARRHEENIEHIRQRALESALAPALAPYRSKKLCTLCNVLISSEVYLLSHVRGKQHLQALRKASGAAACPGTGSGAAAAAAAGTRVKDELHHITEAPPDCVDERLVRQRERQQTLRKKAKKIRVRITSRGQEYENERARAGIAKVSSSNSGRIEKCLRDIEKLHSSQGIGQWSNNAITLLERGLLEINRIFEKKEQMDKSAFNSCDGFAVICKILSLGLDVPQGMSPYLPSKCFVTACSTLTTACQNQQVNAEYFLCSNKVSVILDLLLCRLKELLPDEEHLSSGWTSDSLPADPLAVSLMRLLAQLLSAAESGPVEVRARDIVSYTVCAGVVDRLACVCGAVRDPGPAAFLLAALELLATLIARCGGCRENKCDPTGLGATLRSTELMGSVSMLYGLLLQRQALPPEPRLEPPASCIARATMALLLRVAELDLSMFQSILGAEGISLELRHICAHLLWACLGQDSLRDLLHLVIRVLGFFAVRNHDNQVVLQSGVQPTVLQMLCQLPFQYFSVPTLRGVLFPTLLACCSDNPENRAILEQELSFQLLEDFLTGAVAESDRLMLLVRDTPTPEKKKTKGAKGRGAGAGDRATRSTSTDSADGEPGANPTKGSHAPCKPEPNKAEDDKTASQVDSQPEI